MKKINAKKSNYFLQLAHKFDNIPSNGIGWMLDSYLNNLEWILVEEKSNGGKVYVAQIKR